MEGFFKARVLALGICVLGAIGFGETIKAGMVYQPSPESDFIYKLSGALKDEVFGSNWGDFFNNKLKNNRQRWVRHTFDLIAEVAYGAYSCGKDVVSGRVDFRNRGLWGCPDSLGRTTSKEIRLADSLIGDHCHSIPRHLIWIRELWLKVALDQVLGLSFYNRHEFTMGAFSFSVGRGISLGDAYAVGQRNLGFYYDSMVDQYAFGMLLSGDIFKDILTYDLYGAILENKCASFDDTSQKIRGQEYGKRDCPSRGFGIVSYNLAARLKWSALDFNRPDTLVIEPYLVYHNDGEQRVQFLGDASTKLGTFGLALEYIGDSYEAGFDTSLNFGRQQVRGWDRNSVRIENRDGALIEVNSHVLNAPEGGEKIPFTKGPAQTVIHDSFQDESQNGKLIGTVDEGFLGQPATTVELFNAKNRFRDPYDNTFHGKMFVADAGYWLYKKDLFGAIAFGFASGGSHPHERTQDEKYNGFIGLQEIYAGKRVRSAFILGGAGKMKRPLSNPVSIQAPNTYGSEVSGFSNLILAGGSLKWDKKSRPRKLVVQSNVLAYWQQYPTRAFNAFAENKKERELSIDARNYYGLEINLFVDFYPVKNLRSFVIGSLFIPGGHFTDIKGRPLSADQEKELDAMIKTGGKFVPNIGDNVAFALNTGLEYKF